MPPGTWFHGGWGADSQSPLCASSPVLKLLGRCVLLKHIHISGSSKWRCAPSSHCPPCTKPRTNTSTSSLPCAQFRPSRPRPGGTAAPAHAVPSERPCKLRPRPALLAVSACCTTGGTQVQQETLQVQAPSSECGCMEGDEAFWREWGLRDAEQKGAMAVKSSSHQPETGEE